MMDPKLKGTKTEANLWTAFAGESQARNKYSYFASKAKKDGYVQISKIFEETAANEKEFFYDMCMKFPDDVLVFLSNDMNSSVFLGGREWSWSDMNDDDGIPLPRWWAED